MVFLIVPQEKEKGKQIMTIESMQPEGSSGKRSRKRFPALCRFIGTFILIAIILAFLPLTLPRAVGWEVYEVVSGSMEPAIPVGSAIYVKAASPEEIETGDIIAFQKNGSVITHRVAQNHPEEKEFITKGDANRTEDMTPTPYGSLIGKEIFHIPYAGVLMTVLSGTAGKIYAVLFAVGGVLLRMLGGILEKQGGEKGDGV